MSDKKNDGNLTDASDASDVSIKDSKISRELLLKTVREKDIRVIIYGDIHDDTYTHIPTTFIDQVKDSLKAVYVENVVPYGRPDIDLFDPPKSKNKQNKLKNSNAQISQNPSSKEQAETEIFRNFLNKFDKNSDALKNQHKIIQYIVEQDLIDKTCSFGCHDHKYTRDSLMAAIRKLNKGDLILVSIGQGHLFTPSDAPDHENPKLMRSRTGQLDTKAKDLVVVADDDPGAATVYSDNRTDGNLFASSLSLVDHLSAIDQFGFLTIIGGWYASPLVLDPKSSEDRSFYLNLAVGKLMQRQQGHAQMLIARNVNEWNVPNFRDMVDGSNKVHFEKFQNYMRNYLAIETYARLVSRTHDWDKDFQSQTGVKDATSLFFSPVSYLVPGAKSSLDLKKQIENFRPFTYKSGAESDLGAYYDDGADFDNY
ncbi:MAG: hypothetical protein V7701_09810 [Sneathiella sp.]